MTEPPRYFRLTGQTRAVLKVLNDAGGYLYGTQIVERAGYQKGTIYPILARLQIRGLVTSYWEDSDASTERRPLRHFYCLTPAGKAIIQDPTIASPPTPNLS